MQRAGPGINERGYRGPVGQFQGGDGDLAVSGGGGDVGGYFPTGVGVADGEGHLGACPGQGARGFDANAGGGAGDNGTLAGQVDVGQDLASGGLAVERSGQTGVVAHDVPESFVNGSVDGQAVAAVQA